MFLTNLAKQGVAIHLLKNLTGYRNIQTTAAYFYSNHNFFKVAVELA
jgi:hypothetical protein